MDIVGDIVTLWDLAWRVGGFINDLRHAQDDFIGLKSEAHCLLICIHSLKAETTLKTLKTVGSDEQRQDLKRIITMTELNMKDLNAFIADCNVMVKNEAKRRGWFGVFADWAAKGWATLKFVFKEKQPFRDRLVLPAQSINIFLTSITIIGIGRGLRARSGGRKKGRDSDDDDVEATDGRLKEWANVGLNVAFRERFGIKGAELTLDMEDEIVLYVLHLFQGGRPFHEVAGSKHKHKVEKKVVTRTRSRSRSRGPLTLGKGNNSGQMYVMRKKAEYKPSSERVEIVEKEWESDDDVGGRRPLLALPAPGDDAASVIEVKPRKSKSDDESSSGDSDGGDSGGNRYGVRQERRSSNHQEAAGRRTERKKHRDEKRRKSPAAFMPTDAELRKRKRQVEQEIRQEQRDATNEMLNETSRMTFVRPPGDSFVEEERYKETDQILGTVEYMEQVYGISFTIVRDRETIDSGEINVDATTASNDMPSYDNATTDAQGFHAQESFLASKKRDGQRSQLKAETYASADVDTPDLGYSSRKRWKTEFIRPGKTENRATSYYEELGVVPPPIFPEFYDEYGYGPHYDETRYRPEGRYHRRSRSPHEGGEREVKFERPGPRYTTERHKDFRREVSPPGEPHGPRFEVTSHFSDEDDPRKTLRDDSFEIRHRDTNHRDDSRPNLYFRDELRPSEKRRQQPTQHLDLRRTASYSGPDNHPPPSPRSRQRRTSHRQDEYMTGARYSEDSDSPDDVSGLVVPKPRR